MPPPAEGFAARFVVGPALRTQPDRRLVKLVREGYENAFEEIVRRYGKPLTQYAAAIVGGRAEDVTQDAFSKALLAMRRDGKEIELRPWLFRIVRNTALNDLRDRPPSAEALAEAIAGGATPEEEIERREELAELMRRLQSLPETQRAAIVMRELEGLSHDEIAAALGLSGGGARQAIFRARRALRDGAGMLLPLPLLKGLLSGAASTPVEAAAGTAGVSGVAGVGVAAKATVATVLVAGAVGAGVAVDHNRHQHHSPQATTNGVVADNPAASAPAGPARESGHGSPSGAGRSDGNGPGGRRGHSGASGNEHGTGDGGNGSGSGSRGDTGNDGPANHGARQSGPGEGGGDGPRSSAHGGTGNDNGGGDQRSGRDSGGSSDSGGGSSDDSGGSGGPDSELDDSSGSGSGSTSSDDGLSSGSDGGSDSNRSPESGGGDSGPVDEGRGDLSTSGDSHDGDGLSVQMQPQTQEEP